MAIRVKFWGVRGSIATPLTAAQVEAKIIDALTAFNNQGNDYSVFKRRAVDVGRGVDLTQPLYERQDPDSIRSRMPTILDPARFVREDLSLHQRGTYGGNTSCVEIRFDDSIVICDMGTGLRGLGNSLKGEMFANKGLSVDLCNSHLHWDHIQGLPFFPPLYINKEMGVKNQWRFWGGVNWLKKGEDCMRGQMNSPTFPVSWEEIEAQTYKINFETLHDMMPFSTDGGVKVRVRKLNHPETTFGFRFEYKDRVVVYATDNEQYDPNQPDPRLLDLAQRAHVLIVDCQYDQHTYFGDYKGGVSRMGWGHSSDVAVANLALQAKPEQLILFHHDPASDDAKVFAIEQNVARIVREGGGTSKVTAAYEGMVIDLR